MRVVVRHRGAGVIDARQAIERMESTIAGIDRRRAPLEHATLAYRLGMAHAETPEGDPETNARTALRWYQVALEGFDRRYEPVAHARVLNGAGAVSRALGETTRAAELFEDAAALFEGRGGSDERGAVHNNLGLARLELGDVHGGIEAFDAALGCFDVTCADGRRGRAAALVNKGMAHASTGTPSGVREAISTYEEVIAELGDDAPYHRALAAHSLGVAHMAVAEADAAVAAFETSLEFFTRSGFPYQHSLAQHNLGRALLASGGHRNAQLAMVAVEDSMGVLDPRLHQAEWRQAHATLQEIEAVLERDTPGRSRRQRFIDLFTSSAGEEREKLLRSRLTRLLALPRDAGHSALRELARASAGAPDNGHAYIFTELTVLMELPNEHLEAALRARLAAHRELPGEIAVAADRALDQAVGDALNGPQRVLVRDFLAANGFERP